MPWAIELGYESAFSFEMFLVITTFVLYSGHFA
jgi:hypothetical protein